MDKKATTTLSEPNHKFLYPEIYQKNFSPYSTCVVTNQCPPGHDRYQCHLRRLHKLQSLTVIEEKNRRERRKQQNANLLPQRRSNTSSLCTNSSRKEERVMFFKSNTNVHKVSDKRSDRRMCVGYRTSATSPYRISSVLNNSEDLRVGTNNASFNDFGNLSVPIAKSNVNYTQNINNSYCNNNSKNNKKTNNSSNISGGYRSYSRGSIQPPQQRPLSVRSRTISSTSTTRTFQNLDKSKLSRDILSSQIDTKHIQSAKGKPKGEQKQQQRQHQQKSLFENMLGFTAEHYDKFKRASP